MNVWVGNQKKIFLEINMGNNGDMTRIIIFIFGSFFFRIVKNALPLNAYGGFKFINQ